MGNSCKVSSLSSFSQNKASHTSTLSKLFQKLLVVTAFALIILSPSTAFNGVKKGLTLWIDIIFPGLFMAMIVTSCMLHLFPMSKRSSYLYTAVCGILCGYPIGAILCAGLHKKFPDEPLSEKIMAYCNISSPSFVLNYILQLKCMQDVSRIKLLFCIYIPAVLLLAIILIKDFAKKFTKKSEEKSDADIMICRESENDMATVIDNAIWGAMENMLKIGGYIIAFSCILSYIMNIRINPANAGNTQLFVCIKTAACCLLEITNGISLADALEVSPQLKMVLIITANAFGGLSTIMQTMGMIKGSGLKIKKYIYHKIVFALVTSANAIFMIYVL